MSDRFVFRLGCTTLGLGIAMIAIPWLGAGGALALAAVAVPSVVTSRRAQ